ncbi:hypothetical protein HPB50_027871 [Hyalomma asiaticum]|nr:hypothetical protein HPB50_027871 [Hyalomma asiaticum]
MVSFGSSSGASSSLPSQVHGNKSHYEASGSIKGWSAQKRSLKDKLPVYPRKTRTTPNSAQSSPDSTTLLDGKDKLPVYPRKTRTTPNSAQSSPDSTTLLDGHLSIALKENGPSLEDDPLRKLEAEQARRVLAKYGISTTFLEQSPLDSDSSTRTCIHSFTTRTPMTMATATTLPAMLCEFVLHST